MNTFRILILSLMITLSTGCSTTRDTGQRVMFDSLGTGVGGAAGYLGGDGDPALTTAGAIGGFVVSEGFQAIARSGRKKALRQGIEEGKVIGQQQVLDEIWEKSNGLRSGKSGLESYPLTIPGKVQNGVLYEKHKFNPSSTWPERILIPGPSNDQPQSNHYETIPDLN